MAAAAVRAIAGGIYYLSGVLVKAETKDIAKRLIAKGFRTATEGMKNSKLPIKNVTESNIVTFLVRGLRDAIIRAKELRSPPKIDLKTGRPVGARKKPEEGNLLGNRGQSEFARKYGSRKMGGFGPVQSTRVKEAKDLKLAQGKRAKAKAESSAKPVQSTLKSTQRKYKPTQRNPEPVGIKLPTPAATIAGLIAAAALGRVAYDAYIEKHNPTPSQIKAAEKKIAAIKARKTSTQVQRKARADAAAKRKNNDVQPSKDSSLVGDAGTESKRQKEKKRRAAELAAQKTDAAKRDTPARKRTIEKAVRLAAVDGREGLKKIREDAEKKALTEVLNKKIASRKSTVAKEKAKAISGEYKSLASAKKAGSLYYMHKGKELRAAIYANEIEKASKRIRDAAIKKIKEGK